MPRLLTAAQLAAGALRRVGALSPRDEAADPDELDVALGCLDQIVGELTGTMTCYWLVPDELTLPLEAGRRAYNLLDALGEDYPEAGLQFPLSAYLQPQAGARGPVEIVRRRTHLAHADRDQPGEPSEVYIDRRDPPTLSTWPVVAQAGSSLLLHYQTYAQDLRDSAGNRPHGLPVAWQRWAELATAADIGDGPVRRLQPAPLARLIAKAERAERKLIAFNNREHAAKRFVAYRDF